VRDILRKLAGKLDVKDANQRVTIKTRQAVLHSPEFQALWDRIKHKTTYRVKFDNDRLIADSVKTIQNCPPITKTRVHIRKADLAIGRGGVDTTETAAGAPITLDEADIELPDILTDLQDKTQLTRRSLVRILTESERLDDFARNPQQFIELAAESINRMKRMALVDGIKYQRLGDEYYYAQELFEQEELTGYLKNTLAVTKSVHEHVVYDLGGERTFAEKLEQNTPSRSTPSSPAGSKCRPHWAPTTPTGPSWSSTTEPSGYSSSSRPSPACSPKTYAAKKTPRSNAAKPTSAT
jgi:type III restriction enzyme